ncbi:2OG-Fe(II) oxygenase [Methyloferula stellata]|uniref:2OG-Fe(II)-dependent halogenase WelO5 family protein n=1 Tax=Methyloferula stellata TaxID=876270 RepID=UPI00037B9B6E|nr:2OG-Fe(II) oxygenase [Methyloferula stellata]
MSFLKIATVDARKAESNADILAQLRKDDVQAIVIENLLTSSECDGIVADLEINRHDFPKTYFPEAFRSFFFGANLNLAHPDLADYFAMAPAFGRALDALMKPYGGFEPRVLGVLSGFDRGRSYRAPPGPSAGRRYMATTIRGHEQAGYIPPHFDNEQIKRPSFNHLMPLIEGDVFSFVVTLHRSLEGGALEVYDVTADRFGDSFVNRDGHDPKPDLSGRERVTFDVADGTMVIVRSGRYLHRLSPVGGGRTRWTFCSFMAQSRADGTIFCWG